MDTKLEPFFPADINEFRHDWYAANLQAMNEPSLFRLSSSAANFLCRCLWLRSFRSSICIRVEADSRGAGVLFMKEISCDASEKPAELVKDVRKIVDASSLGRVTKLLDGMRFFELPTSEELPFGMDGERWIFECVRNGRYHIVDRYCPDVIERDHALVDLGEQLLGLADSQSGTEPQQHTA